MLDSPLEISKHADHHGEHLHLKASEMTKSLKVAWEEKSIFQNIPGLSPYKVLTNKN